MKFKLKHLVVVFFSLLFLVACEKSPNQAGNLVPKTVDEDPNLPAVEVNQTKLHLQTFGNPDNPVMIFLHGGPGAGDYRCFMRFLDTYNGYNLTDEYYIIMYDQRGAGLSRRYGNTDVAELHQVEELSLANYLKDLEEIVNIYSPNNKVILFGHSWGGMHAIMYVNAHPEKVAAVILSEPGSFNADIENELSISIASTNLFGEETNDFYWAHQNISPDDQNMLDYSYMNGFYNGLGLAAYHFDEVDKLPIFRFGTVANINDLGPDGETPDGVFTFDFSQNLHNFTTKVLFINGSLNEILTPEFQEKNRAFLPNSEIKIIENVGHDLIWTATADHVAFMKEYLDEVLPTSYK
ncbi:MAG: alpha/beta hydrolase [Bacteroidales bacterium]|nr:alpha/beta hydrolase [Bacteroidales bacterium]